MAKKRGDRKRRGWVILVVVIAVLIGARLALPYVILHYANKTLATMEGYRGHIRDIDIALIRGAYQIDSAYLNKVDSITQQETPFVAVSKVDLSVEWAALLQGSIVGEVTFRKPVIRFTRNKVEPKDVQKDSSQLKHMLDGFMPLKVNRFNVHEGQIQYIDHTSNPPVDVSLTDAEITGINLINSYDSANTILPASIRATANIYDGTLSFNMKLDPLAEDPTFDMNAELKNTNLVKLNDFFKAYAKADVSKGSFGLFTEIAAKDGRFNGYVKPLIKDLKMLGAEDRKDNILKKLWEGLIGTAGEVFENQRNDQLATKIPFEGRINNPQANIWYAIVQVMQNAFVHALQPSFDQDINIAAVETDKEKAGKEDNKKTMLGRLFSKDDDATKEAKKQKRKERKAKKKEERRKKRERRDDEKS
ncbi:DUF748 domain-containing protein [Fulvivirgaceae bacterium PWU4]|uniref:DUF748 domain-containing protein n=1 Tax=Chryseosolibacter histidini TaxID=2782349 RepID=A0AAP2DR76_9BACT|nr:DUF748 domain-containing protein [Chryseosolibacter histidini]MBT1701013.1 DUF748 domain-containing protein [Chryseosolibacter histidini]